MLDRITGMRLFARAATAGSLSAAARHLEMSPAMASKHVGALEARLGVKLFHRSTRRLSLTEAGSNYLEACQRILPEIEEAEASVASQRIEATGLLRMNVPLTFGTQFIAPLIPEFSRRHPAVKVELGLTDSRIDLIDGGWDMAVRIGRLQDSPMQARQLADSPLLVCAAPRYLDERGVPRSVADLGQHNCLGYSLASLAAGKAWPFGRNAEVRIAELTQIRNLVAAAVGGQGVIYQPQFIVAKALRSGELVALALDQPCVELGGIHVVYPPNRRPPAKVRVMIDYLVDAFSADLPWSLSPD